MDYSGVTVPIAQSHKTMGTAIHTACNHQGLQHCNCHSTKWQPHIPKLSPSIVYLERTFPYFCFHSQNGECWWIFVTVLSQFGITNSPWPCHCHVYCWPGEADRNWLKCEGARRRALSSIVLATTVQVSLPTSRSWKCSDKYKNPHQLFHLRTQLLWN